MSQNVAVSFGVNKMNLEIAGQSLATVAHQLKSLLGLAGGETQKVNGREAANDYILKAGDRLEFVKVSGRKGSIAVSAGVNRMDLELAGKTVSQVRKELASLLHIDNTWKAEVNGATCGATKRLRNGDSLEFIKDSGTKGDG